MVTRALCSVAVAAALALTPATASAIPEKEDEKGGSRPTPLEQAREESSVRSRPPRRFALPAGAFRLSASELLASTRRELELTVELDRDIAQATLEVTLPRRWVGRSGVSGLPYADVPTTGRAASARAAVRRAGRTVTFAFDGGRAGDAARFALRDNGIPAGTYGLPYRWREVGGRTVNGKAEVIVFAPTREEQHGESPDGPDWLRLASPGMERNATDDALTESETFLTVVPGDRKRFIVGANGGGGYSAWVTNDGGQTFSRAPMPAQTDAPGEVGPETADLCCDPMSAADAAGNIWYGGLSFANGVGQPSRIVVNRIAPGATSFQPQTVGLRQRTNGTQDKPMMTIDNSPSSPRFGRLYVVWNEPASGGLSIVISQCDTRVGGVLDAARCDNADNWTTPVSVTPTTGSYIYADVAAAPDGTVHVVWWDFSSANAIRGDSCGTAANCASATGWGTPQTIATLDATGGAPIPFECPIVAQPGGRASTSPQVDVDRSGGTHHGRVYVTWSDLRTGSGTTRCGNNATPASTHLTWDSFVASAAGGLPGSANPSPNVGTRLITDGEASGQANSDDWFAWLAVDQSTGQAWADLYSTRDDATRRTTHFYVRTVTPTASGHALGTLTRVSGAPSDYSTTTCCAFANDYGDYTGIDATQGIALPTWSDRRSGADGEAYTFVRVEPSLVPDILAVADGGGDGDGVLEPGEPFTLTQRLRNAGSASATGVSATLQESLPEVTLSQDTSPYPDIAAGAAQDNATPFAGTLASSAGCGVPLAMRLEAATGDGPFTVPVNVPTGAVGAVQAFSATPGAAIPDASPSGASSDVAVSGVPGQVRDVDVRVDITHTFDADLVVTLRSPDGTTIPLVQNRGGGEDNFSDTVFDDEAGTAISAGSAPFSGSFRPEQPLSTFDGKDPNGTWRLTVVDSAGDDVGTLNSWEVSVRGSACDVAPGPDPDPDPDPDPEPDPDPSPDPGPGQDPGAPGTPSPGPGQGPAGGTPTQQDSQGPPSDRSVILTLRAPRAQRALRARGLRVAVACPLEACRASARGLVALPSARRGGRPRRARTRSASRALRAGRQATLVLRFSTALRRRIARALRSRSTRNRVRATIRVVVTDAAGNRGTRRLTVRLRR